jgi:hypothetical protein
MRRNGDEREASAAGEGTRPTKTPRLLSNYTTPNNFIHFSMNAR